MNYDELYRMAQEAESPMLRALRGLIRVPQEYASQVDNPQWMQESYQNANAQIPTLPKYTGDVKSLLTQLLAMTTKPEVGNMAMGMMPFGTIKGKAMSVPKSIKLADLPDRAVGMGKETYNYLKNSIQEKGFTQPIIVDKSSKEVLDGLKRLSIARELGMNDIPVMWVNKDNMTRKDLENIISKLEKGTNQTEGFGSFNLADKAKPKGMRSLDELKNLPWEDMTDEERQLMSKMMMDSEGGLIK